MVIPKTATPRHARKNRAALGVTLTGEDLHAKTAPPELRDFLVWRFGRVWRLPTVRQAGGEKGSDAFLPKLEVILLDRQDLEPAGAGETPIIAIAPAIANAVFDVTGKPAHGMPIRIARG